MAEIHEHGGHTEQQPLLPIAGIPKQESDPVGWRDRLVGTLDWAYFCKPLSVYSRNKRPSPLLRFWRVQEWPPLVLSLIMGFQYTGATFGPLLVPAIMLKSFYPASFGNYMVQIALIIAGVSSLLQCLEVKIPGTSYQIGTGLSSFLTNSNAFAVITVSLVKDIAEKDEISHEDAYGKVLGTTALCTLPFIALTLVPRKYVKAVFPPTVSGVILALVGIESFIRGYQFWGGGPDCATYSVPCSLNGHVQAPYGSPEFMGLGFLVVVVYLMIVLFGTAFMRQNQLFIAGGCAFVVACIGSREGERYVVDDPVDAAIPINSPWTTTFKLGLHKGAVLPVLGAYLVTYLQANAVLTGNIVESRLNVQGSEEDDRIQGGLIGTGIMSLFSALATGLPVTPVPETTSYAAMSGVASRPPAICGAVWLILLGVFGHLFGITLMVPIVVNGGLVSILAGFIVLTGVKVLTRESWSQHTATIVLFALVFGLSNSVMHNFIGFTLWPLRSDASQFIRSIRFAIVSMLRIPYFLGGLAAMILHLLLPKDIVMEGANRLEGVNKNGHTCLQARSCQVLGCGNCLTN